MPTEFDLPRRRPEAIPALHPVPEYLASGERKRRYEEMKAVFQTPWMGVITMAYAHYETFYGVLWDGVKELCASRAFVSACQELRAFAEARAATLAPPPLRARLAAQGYAPREIEDIRAIVEVFAHGNFPYLLLATLTRRLIEGGEFGGDAEAEPFVGRHAPDVRPPFVLMEAHHADPELRALYEDVKATLKLPFVNTDYRALARWPSYFRLAWGDLRGVAGAPAHEAAASAIHARAVVLVGSLPNPGRLTAAALQAAAGRDAPLAEVREMARLFQWLLPGLVANVAFFQRQLDG
jgi:hypothetical protein